MLFVSRTRATLRSAEFGFLGVVVYTRVHTPRRCGLPFSAAVLVLATLSWRPLRTSCWIVGIRTFFASSVSACSSAGAVLFGVRGAGRGRFTPPPEVGRVAPWATGRSGESRRDVQGPQTRRHD